MSKFNQETEDRETYIVPNHYCMGKYQIIDMENEKVFTKNAVGRICAEVIAECPPGIFILLPGERITQEHIHYLQNYEHIHVLK